MPIKYEELVKTVVFDVIATQCSFAEYKPDESIDVLDSHSHSIDLDGKLFDHPQSCVDFVANALEKNFKKE